jgi:hypothetical protein
VGHDACSENRLTPELKNRNRKPRTVQESHRFHRQFESLHARLSVSLGPGYSVRRYGGQTIHRHRTVHFMDGCVELNTDFGSGDESRNHSGLTYATLGINLIFGQVTVFKCIATDVCGS